MDILNRNNEHFHSIETFNAGENAKLRGVSVEKKIEFIENLAGKVSNRKSRRWLNDRLLMELIPSLHGEEIRGLFTPPPWGDDVPLSAFCMTNVETWDNFRTIDMDTEACMIEALEDSMAKKKGQLIDVDKVAVLNAWHRIDCRTRDALRRSFLSDLIESYEKCLHAFIKECREDVLVLHVQDPFHRLLLHGVCEFYNLVSVTESDCLTSLRTTKIKKKHFGTDIPNISLSDFLKLPKD